MCIRDRDAMTPQLVDRSEFPAIAALGTLRHSLGSIAGPALAGVAIARLGLASAYLIDAATFLVSLVALAAMSRMPPMAGAARPGLTSIAEGLRYARRRPS